MKRPLVLMVAALAFICISCGGRDNTPPKVISTTPQQNATTARLDAPFEVLFSEPLSQESFSESNVQFRVAGQVMSVQVRRGANDRTMLIQPTRQPAALPATAALRLSSGIRDRAGNPLVPFEWKFTLAAWVPLGDVVTHEGTRDVRGYALTVFDGEPLLVWSEKDGDEQSAAYAARWDGDARAWTFLGDYVGPTLTAQVLYPDVVVAEGVPWVIYQRSRVGRFECHAARWNGTAWESGEALDHHGGSWCYGPKMAWGDRLYGAWTEWDPGNHKLYGAWGYLQAGSWQPGSPEYESNVSDLQLWDLEASTDEKLWAAYGKDGKGYVSEYGGGAWTLLGGGPLDADGNPSTNTFNASLVVDDDGHLWAAWKEGGQVRVARWDGFAWRYHSPSGADGFNPSLAYADGSLYLAWYSNQAEGVRVLRLEEPTGDWQAVGGTYRADAYGSPRIAVLPGGWPVLAWTEKTSAGDVFLRAVVYNHVP